MSGGDRTPWPSELMHAESCAWRFGASAKCDCGLDDGTIPNPTPDVMPVARKRCDECLYSSARIVDVHRRDEVIASCRESGYAFQCHKATLAGAYVVCRGHFDADDSTAVVLAKLVERVVFVDLPVTS